MVEDARFEDGADQPLALRAVEPDDLEVISSLVQDAVFPVSEAQWHRKDRRFAVLLNRFRWEDRRAAESRARPYERVQTVLLFQDVLNVQTQGVDPTDKETVVSLLSIAFEPSDECGGRVILTLSGDGAIAVDVECIEATLKDVTRPYLAPSRKAPHHPE